VMRGGDGILVWRGVCAARGGVLVGVLAASAAAHCVLMWRDCGFAGERDGGEGTTMGSGGRSRRCRGARRYRGRRRGLCERVSAAL
jgi:hypothetical protein